MARGAKLHICRGMPPACRKKHDPLDASSCNDNRAAVSVEEHFLLKAPQRAALWAQGKQILNVLLYLLSLAEARSGGFCGRVFIVWALLFLGLN